MRILAGVDIYEPATMYYKRGKRGGGGRTVSGNLVSEPSICDQLLFVQLITLRLVAGATGEVALLIFAMARRYVRYARERLKSYRRRERGNNEAERKRRGKSCPLVSHRSPSREFRARISSATSPR